MRERHGEQPPEVGIKDLSAAGKRMAKRDIGKVRGGASILPASREKH